MSSRSHRSVIRFDALPLNHGTSVVEHQLVQHMYLHKMQSPNTRICTGDSGFPAHFFTEEKAKRLLGYEDKIGLVKAYIRTTQWYRDLLTYVLGAEEVQAVRRRIQ